jgi:hypothetical protein
MSKLRHVAHILILLGCLALPSRDRATSCETKRSL